VLHVFSWECCLLARVHSGAAAVEFSDLCRRDRLGLSGSVGKEDWDALCDNRTPGSGTPLTPRQKLNRRVGYDFNFHVPKSVPLLYALTEDARILNAFQDAVDSTMHDMESEAKARVRKQGTNEDRITGNLVWGEFVHLTARPEGGVPDPHLHAHCLVFNANFNPEEDRWKAAQLGDLKRDAPYFEAVFNSRLARQLETLGLETERTATGWELKRIAPETLVMFSRRTARIEEIAKVRGITDPTAKAELGAPTRARKAAQLSMPELQELWRSKDSRAATEAVERAMAHSFERASVIPERMFLAEALRQGTGKASRESVETLAAHQPLVRATRIGRALVTTQAVLAEESKMLEIARSGREQWRPIREPLATFTREWLNTEQRAAVQHVLTSRGRVMIIRGAAGAGKTSALQELREAVEATETSG